MSTRFDSARPHNRARNRKTKDGDWGQSPLPIGGCGLLAWKKGLPFFAAEAVSFRGGWQPPLRKGEVAAFLSPSNSNHIRETIYGSTRRSLSAWRADASNRLRRASSPAVCARRTNVDRPRRAHSTCELPCLTPARARPCAVGLTTSEAKRTI